MSCRHERSAATADANDAIRRRLADAWIRGYRDAITSAVSARRRGYVGAYTSGYQTGERELCSARHKAARFAEEACP